MKVLKNNLAKDDIFVVSGYGPFIFIRPSTPRTITYLTCSPLLLIGHVETYIVLIKGGASERCDFSKFGKRQFSYGIYN